MIVFLSNKDVIMLIIIIILFTVAVQTIVKIYSKDILIMYFDRYICCFINGLYTVAPRIVLDFLFITNILSTSIIACS